MDVQKIDYFIFENKIKHFAVKNGFERTNRSLGKLFLRASSVFKSTSCCGSCSIFHSD